MPSDAATDNAQALRTFASPLNFLNYFPHKHMHRVISEHNKQQRNYAKMSIHKTTLTTTNSTDIIIKCTIIKREKERLVRDGNILERREEA